MSGVVHWFRRKSHEQQLDAELRFHIEQQTKDNIAAGMSPATARREAAIGLGGLEQIKEACRDQRSGVWLGQLTQDFSFGLRMLRKNPGFMTVAVLTLGLGIGANTAIFSFVNGVMLKPLPYANADRIVRLTEILPEGKGYAPASLLNYLDWERQNAVFDLLACTVGGR